MRLVPNNYYVIVAKAGEEYDRQVEEQILIKFLGESIATKGSFMFKFIAELIYCSEGVPEKGSIIHVTQKQIDNMHRDGFYFREPTPTEMVLYGRA